ncbi:TORTIFOLIA1-like protein 2 [Cucurbita moschata]|uniref:TORTIFOLIA1-like protein 2 n=1 Tax=Cucurbita moschata TaxID=3662 RepID=A0A6J1EE59_CUCMO|nr:TORTIFOLIA1-like protein 2 [Cucurbita moschata]XP_022926199.1 TORTIFOLIA1-like protein 2 [Cucurbita moschata]
MMKTQGYVKGRAPTKMNAQQLVFELKQKVVLALNKLADRDTYQIGYDELEKTAECIAPDMIPPFLSCILDIDSEQKSAVRQECIRLMGTLAKSHEGLIRPHLRRIVGSIVKRLKDSDSAVRDACGETCGVLASKLISVGDESDEVFVTLVKPIFEGLGEQHKQMQTGSAFCLARIIDNTQDPPVSILQRMLARTTKLLKNPHFMGKPAVIDLNRSIIQAGGASNRNVLSAAMLGIQEALKNSDWTTRKAASVALGDIATSCGSFLGSFKASCTQSLESCRFDKVKPVRDIVLQTLQYWNNVQGPDTPEPSEAGSSIKENLCGGDFSDVTSSVEHGKKDTAIRKVGMGSTRGRIPLNMRKTCPRYLENTQHFKANDCHIEIAVPQKHNQSLSGFYTEESEGSTITKTFQGVSSDATDMQDIEYDYVRMDDKQECSSEDSNMHKSTDRNKRFVTEEATSEGQIYSTKVTDRRSLDSVVTESSCQVVQECDSEIANDMVCIRKHLLEIENKQSNLMDLFKEFTSGIMDSLSVIQSRVVGLEHVVYGLSQDLLNGNRDSEISNSKFMKQNQGLNSPRLSTSTPRPSVDITGRQSSLLSLKHSNIWDENVAVRSQLSNASKRGTDIWRKTNSVKNPPEKDLQNSSSSRHLRNANAVFSSSPCTNVRQFTDGKNSILKRVSGFLRQGDVDTAYIEALRSGDEAVLFELLDQTGPVLECLSPKTISNILPVLASFLPEQKFIRCIIPWLQQVVDLSTMHGANSLGLSAKERQEFVLAIQEASKSEFSNPAETRLMTQLATKLCYIWGQGS